MLKKVVCGSGHRGRKEESRSGAGLERFLRQFE
jgi:hypothetical protein